MGEEPAAMPVDEGARRQMRAELEELQGYVTAFGIERIKDGTWFDEFVRAMLHAYSDEAKAAGGTARLQARFPA